MKAKIIRNTALPKPQNDIVQQFIDTCPPGTLVMVRVSPYIIDVKDTGHAIVAKEAYDGSIVITKPFKFCNQWAVKVEGFQGQPVFINRITPFGDC